MSGPDDLGLALGLTDIADFITTRRFRASDLVVDTKPDLTPVSEADRAVEERLRAELAEARPADAVVGEEYGASGRSNRTWLIDPIDGTKNYVRGIPVYATLIALVVDGVPQVGVVSAPELGRRWWAERGNGALLNGEPIGTSSVVRIEDSQLSYNDLRTFGHHGHHEAVEELTRRAWRVRGFGDFWSHAMVADGSVDIAVEPAVNPWDLAPLQVLVEEAGGRFTDLSGRRGFEGGSVLATNGHLHDEVLALFREGRGPEEAG